MAYAEKNCVIVKEDDLCVYYLPKCEKCGWTNNSQAGASKSPSFDTFNSSFMCPECQEIRQVVLHY